VNALRLRGPYRGWTGHDHHVREFVRALHHRGVQIQLSDITEWSPLKLPAALREPWFDSLRAPVPAKVMLHFCMPPQVRLARGLRNANFTMFEASRIPQQWLAPNLRHDLVILPTESSQRAWVDSGFPEERIRLCPLGVDPLLFRPGARPLPLQDVQGRDIQGFRYRFLNVSDVTPRKNVLGLLRVWLQATTQEDDAVLILKLSCGWRSWLRRFFYELEAMEAQMGKSRQKAAPSVFLINHPLGDSAMPALYATATHYWSMSFGEGWDNPMIEAAAMGLQLIAPAHSAYTTYLDDSVATMIPARRVPAVFHWDRGLERLFQGAEWWQPDEAIAAEVLRHILRGSGQTPRREARSRVGQHFTWDRAAGRLVEIVEELEAR
jgi:glycosyltransferase involved in cell wall biosynthesis